MTFDADELEKRIVDKLAKDSVMYPITYTMRAFVHALCLALQEMQEAQAAHDEKVRASLDNDSYDNYGSGD